MIESLPRLLDHLVVPTEDGHSFQQELTTWEWLICHFELLVGDAPHAHLHRFPWAANVTHDSVLGLHGCSRRSALRQSVALDDGAREADLHEVEHLLVDGC